MSLDMMDVKLVELDHVGTRRQHWMDLMEHCSTAVFIAEEHNYFHSQSSENITDELRVVVGVLQKLLRTEYREGFYRREINGLDYEAGSSDADTGVPTS